jgi:hypothetical protein
MQIVNTTFNDNANKDIVPLTGGVKISFDKTFDDEIIFGTYDESKYDGDSLYAPTTDEPINFWDFYQYTDYSSRLIGMEWTRELDFPYSVSAAMADFTMNNTDDYFTRGSASEIADDILPKRPIRLLAGYANDNLQQFIGITDKLPVVDETRKTASFHANDFFTEIFESKLAGVIAMENARTDEVLAVIFDLFGLSPDSYVLARGRNVIPFVFFDADKNAGNAIRELMQAEGGHLWIDEQGVIRFETRLPSVSDPIYSLDDRSVFELTRSGQTGIINSINITSEIRKVDRYKEVYSNIINTDDLENSGQEATTIPAGGSAVLYADLENPCLVIDEPTYGESSGASWLSAIKLDGTTVTSGVSVDGNSLETNRYVLFVSNSNAFDVKVSGLYLWGRPAILVNTLRLRAKDQDSIDKFGVMALNGADGISNNFFGSLDNARSFAQTIIDAYKDENPTLEARVSGNLALQLGDVIYVTARGIDENYRVTSIKVNFKPWSYKIKATRYSPRSWAKYDVTVYDDPVDVIAP